MTEPRSLANLIREQAALLQAGADLAAHAALLENIAVQVELRQIERQALHNLCETLVVALSEILARTPGMESQSALFTAVKETLVKTKAFGVVADTTGLN